MRILLLSIYLLSLSTPAIADNYLLIISGLGGEPAFSEQFQQWSEQLQLAAQKAGLKNEQIIYLTAKPELSADQNQQSLDKKAVDKKAITQALAELQTRVQPGEQIIIVLFGHGSSRSGDALFNIPGPDISAAEFADLLQAFDQQTVVFINTSSASGAFIRALSAPNRVIISATASGAERYYAVFGGFFARALTEPGADTDKDNRVSILEAFEYARREVQRDYDKDKRLLTEHAVLDDNGDGKGSREATAKTADGRLASQLFIGSAAVFSSASNIELSPELKTLFTDKQSIEQRITALIERKTELVLENYEDQLEELLVELALKRREIRHSGGKL